MLVRNGLAICPWFIKMGVYDGYPVNNMVVRKKRHTGIKSHEGNEQKITV
jgi:hypothetical protein